MRVDRRPPAPAGSDAARNEPGHPGERRVRAPSLESLFVATFALLGVRVGAQPIVDNSAFVHLRVGIDALAGAGIPRRDPYSFTASGEPWVVQSWLADLSYGLAHRLGGTGGVVLQHAIIFGLLAWLLARLARTGSPLRTALAAGLTIGAGLAYWSPRPLMIGLAAFALSVTVVERRLSRWWLVPIVWVWVNTHGSFVLGLAWLVLATAGEALDRRGRPEVFPRYLAAFGVGLAGAAVNPLGPRLLAFSATLFEKRSVFATIVEWRSPTFGDRVGLLSLLCLVTSLVIVARARTQWSALVPVVGFVAAGFVAQRNIPMAAVVLAPALGRALRPPAPALSPIELTPSPPPRPLNLVFAAAVAAAMLVFAVAGLRGPGLDLAPYPVAAVSWADEHGLVGAPRRVVTQDHVGGYLILRFGREAQVFIDDRVDMYPVTVSRDYRTLLHGRGNALAVLDRHRVDAVIWKVDAPLATILDATGRWHRVYSDSGWAVFLRG